jgi:predicted nucleic-acid-binding protein
MIAFDTNALIRILIDDDPKQAKIIKDLIIQVETNSGQILILSEVLIETVWVLEESYKCTREEISGFLETLAHTPVFATTEPSVLGAAISQYKHGGDFADLVIVFQAKHFKANKLISFDKKLQKKFPDYVVESLVTTLERGNEG